MNKAKKGFTLIEIMIVVAILAILAAVAIPNFISYRKESQKSACLANLKALDAAAEAYLVKNPGATSISVSDLYKTDGSGLMKSNPTCPCSGSYSYNTTKQIWECSGAQNTTGYEHTR